MSLALAVVQKNFILASCDSAVTVFDEEDRSIMTPTDFKSKKVHRISDKVLLLATGMTALTEIIQVEMEERVKSHDDLHECRKIAKDIFNNMKAGKIANLEKIESNLSVQLNLHRDLEEEIREALTFIEENPVHFSAYLVGYNDDWTSGLVDIKEDAYIQIPEDEEKGYPVVIAGPDPNFSAGPKRSKYQMALSVPIDERTIERFIDAMVYVHTGITTENQINVSPDCNFHLLFRTEDSIEHTEFAIDTSLFLRTV